MWIRLSKPVDDHKAGEFLEVAEATGAAYVSAGLAEDGGNGPEHHLMRSAMADFQKTLAGFAKQTAETLSETTREIAKRPSFSTIEHVEAEADKRRSITGYLRDIVHALGNPDVDARTESHKRLITPWGEGGYGVKRGLTEGQGSAGGYTTPVIYEQQLFQVAAENGVLAPAAQQVPLGARDVEWPALDQYGTGSTGQSSFYGGVKVYRKTESAQRTATQPAFSKVKLTAIDLTAYTEISRDLVMDSTANIDGLVTQLMGNAIGWREDYEALFGSGVGEFLGVMNAPATIAVTRNTSSHFKYQDIFSMYKRIVPSLMKSSGLRWIIHPYSLDELFTIVDASSRYLMVPYPTAGPEAALSGPLVYRMLGIPVMVSEKVSGLGTAGDLILVDANSYLIGRRSGLEIGLSEHFKFDTDQLAIRAKIRNDGQPWLRKAITLMDNSSTVSAYTYLN